MERKFIKLIDADGRTHLGSVHVLAEDVDMLTVEVKKRYADSYLRGIEPSDLMVFRDKHSMNNRLGVDDSIKGMGVDGDARLILHAPFKQSSLLAEMKVLASAVELRRECENILRWTAGEAKNVKHIHEFMKPLGGCTRKGTVYWREEERQVASILLSEWSQELGYPNKASIVSGSPGVGKSTMLCILAIYVALVMGKDVLVVRNLKLPSRPYCLFYIGHRGGQVLWFSVNSRDTGELKDIYKALDPNPGSPCVGLMLDGFLRGDIPNGFGGFHLLATSQQVKVKSDEEEHTLCILFPSWYQDDIFHLGRSLHDWNDEEMETRFFYSGGSVRDFTKEPLSALVNSLTRLIAGAVKDSDGPIHLLSSSESVSSGAFQIDRLRHTFLRRAFVREAAAYQDCTHWDQVVDSEFAISRLRDRLRARDLSIIYEWAVRGGSQYASLAGALFELIIHHLAADNKLRLNVSPYHQLARGQPQDARSINFRHVELVRGKTLHSGSNESECLEQLEAWYSEPDYSYWHPVSAQFPSIDSVAKIADGGGVAYLQMTVSKEHGVDASKLSRLNQIFWADRTSPAPMFIIVCPNVRTATKFILTNRADAYDAAKVCRVFVGYCQDGKVDPIFDGPRNRNPIPERPTGTHMTLRSRAQTEDIVDDAMEQDVTEIAGEGFVSTTMGDFTHSHVAVDDQDGDEEMDT